MRLLVSIPWLLRMLSRVALQESLRGQHFSTDWSTPTACHTSLSGPPTLAAWLASLALLTLSPWAHVMANCSTCLVATLYLPPLPPSGMVCVISRTMTVAVGVGALMPPVGTHSVSAMSATAW